MDMIDEIFAFNKKFVANKEYVNYQTSKFPDKKVVIVSCMDTRLSQLLINALGFKNGDVKIIKNAGGVVMHPFATAMRSILITVYEYDVEEVLIIGHDGCGMASIDKSHVIDKMISLGIKKDTIDLLKNSGIDIKEWLAGFENVDDSVKSSVELVKNHPLLHDKVRVTGLIINPETGELRYAK